MSKLYAIRQTKFDKYWYDFVEDFTSAELDRNCISNNFTYVKECQDSLATLNPAWKNSEIVEFRQLGDLDDFEDLYYKSIEQRADLEAKLADSEREILSNKNMIVLLKEQETQDLLDNFKKKRELEKQNLEKKAYLYQIYSHLGVEAFGEDIQEQALKEIGRLQQQLAESEEKNRDLEDDHNKLIEQYNKQYNDLCKEINVHSSARERLVKKVKELEQQLAEKEHSIGMLNQHLTDKAIEIDRLGEELTEKETRIAELEDKDWYEATIKQLEEQNERVLKKLELIVSANQELERKVAEKEKEISVLKSQLCLCQISQSINQDKISFAVEQLEKVKELCKKKFDWWENSEWEGNIYDKSDVSNAYFDIEAIIDNQIEELKKEMK